MLAAASAGLEVSEYSPLTIKSSVVGYGRAEKQQVQHMVTRLLELAEPPEPLDASDALAIAICHLHNDRNVSTGSERSPARLEQVLRYPRFSFVDLQPALSAAEGCP